MVRTRILSPERVRRTLSRLACQVIERNQGVENLEIIGIRTRGHALAQILASLISGWEGKSFDVNSLKIAAYRDDLDHSKTPKPEPQDFSIDVTDRDILLVDDVLFTGRTARAAMDALIRIGRPRSIQLAVLVDRGHREFPIQPDYVGRVLQTKNKEHVVVEVSDDVSVFIEE